MKSEKCAICGSQQSQILTVAKKYHACRLCGYVRQIDIESFDSIYEYYGNTYYDRKDHTERYIQKQSDWSSHIVRFIEHYGKDDLRGGARVMKAIEIGSAYGVTLTALGKSLKRKNKEIELYGVELSKNCLKHGVENYKEIHVLSETLEALETDKKFDIVILSHVLEHFIDPVIALRKVVTLCNHGAIIFIEVPNFFYHNATSRAHVSCFTTTSLRNCLHKAGLTPSSLKVNDHESCFHRPYITCLARVAEEERKVTQETVRLIELKRNLGLSQRWLHRALSNNLIWRGFRKIRRDYDPHMRLYS